MVTPSCASGPIPSGNGGTIIDGTYVLTGETYYGGACFQQPGSGTLLVAGACWQEVGDAAQDHVTASFAVTSNGNMLTITPTCSPSGARVSGLHPTFTADGAVLTVYFDNSQMNNGNPDYTNVFTRQ